MSIFTPSWIPTLSFGKWSRKINGFASILPSFCFLSHKLIHVTRKIGNLWHNPHWISNLKHQQGIYYVSNYIYLFWTLKTWLLPVDLCPNTWGTESKNPIFFLGFLATKKFREPQKGPVTTKKSMGTLTFMKQCLLLTSAIV